jgi:hypothetical protein
MVDGMRFIEVLKGVAGKRLTYKALIGKGGSPTNLLGLDSSGESESRPN